MCVQRDINCAVCVQRDISCAVEDEILRPILNRGLWS